MDLDKDKRDDRIPVIISWPSAPFGELHGFPWKPEEWAAIQEIMQTQELTEYQVIRQAIGFLQQHNRKLRDGETFHYSGDTKRAEDFAGPLITERLYKSMLSEAGQNMMDWWFGIITFELRIEARELTKQKWLDIIQEARRRRGTAFTEQELEVMFSAFVQLNIIQRVEKSNDTI